jgi:twitching motility protein PilT
VTDDAPRTEADIPRIIDVYGYIRVSPGFHEAQGGAGAYCYYGPPKLARLGGTDLEAWADDLLRAADKVSAGREDFLLNFGGFNYRGCRDEAEMSTHVSLRRMPTSAPRLSDLHTETPAIRRMLEGEWLNDGGLVVFAGLTGQGKTTWAGATVRTRLELFGGRCVTVEDVNEMPLEGLWGPGSCRQMTVDYTNPDPWKRGFSGTMRKAYRSLPATRPGLLLIGEVRDTETAEEVVKAASNGMLVITTIHASDPIAAIMRLVSLSERAMGMEAALSNIGHSLRLIIHNRIQLNPRAAGWSRGRFSGTALVSTGHQAAVGSLIRSGKLSMLAAEIQFQQQHLASATTEIVPLNQLLATICRTG